MVILAPVAVLGPEIAERDLGGAAAWGLITSCLSIGAVGGQVIAGRIRPPARPALVLACLVPAMTGQALGLGLGASLPVIAALTVVTGVAFGFQAVIFPVAMQTSVPPEALARVAAIDLLGSEAGQPVGYALAGPIGEALGAHVVLAAAGVGMFLGSAAFSQLRPLHAEVSGHPYDLREERADTHIG
jgi:MFS family permease